MDSHRPNGKNPRMWVVHAHAVLFQNRRQLMNYGYEVAARQRLRSIDRRPPDGPSDRQLRNGVVCPLESPKRAFAKPPRMRWSRQCSWGVVAGSLESGEFDPDHKRTSPLALAPYCV